LSSVASRWRAWPRTLSSLARDSTVERCASNREMSPPLVNALSPAPRTITTRIASSRAKSSSAAPADLHISRDTALSRFGC
jgi:hypothetical protein